MQERGEREEKMNKITKIRGNLLEGCVWDENIQRLYFVDIECRKIYQINPDTLNLDKMEVPDYVSCIVLEKNGKLIVTLPDGMYRVDFQNKRLKGIMSAVLPDGMRYNDGKCDADGRLWVGSMQIIQNSESKNTGRLYCIQKEKIVKTYFDYTIPNGLAWENKNNYFYHIDTPTKRVDKYRIENHLDLVDKNIAVDLSNQQGSPDGMCIDEEGHLWIAMWGGGKVICADPKTGKILDEIFVPDQYVSCCTFGGKEMDQLYITTARDADGNGGEVYVEKMNVRGVVSNRYE